MSKCRTFLVVVVATMFIFVLQAPHVFAASAYDGTIRTTSTLEVTSPTGEYLRDVTYTWNTYMSEATTLNSSTCGINEITDFNNAVGRGFVAIAQNQARPGYGKSVFLYWDSLKQAGGFEPSYFNSLGTESLLYAPPVTGGAEINLLYDGTVSINCVPYTGWYTSPNVAAFATSAQISDMNLTVFKSSYPVNYPIGYAGQELPKFVIEAEYVAMGDSFSSGEGNPPFENSLNLGCHRSERAYPRLLEKSKLAQLNGVAFVACSGATTDNLLLGQGSEPAQISALSPMTKVVTLTIGGNDIGFGQFATECAVSICNFSTPIYATTRNKIANELPTKLAGVLGAIDARTSSTAKVYVIGYPQIAPSKMPTGASSACWPLNGGLDTNNPNKNDGATAYAVVSQLNAEIRNSVEVYGSTKFKYVEPNYDGSPFQGHDWCSQDRYFQIVSFNDTAYSFHPNINGHIAYETIVTKGM